MLNKGLSPRSARYVHAILHRALKQAVRWNLIGRNPADAIDPPRPARKEIAPLTPDQVRRLLATARGDRHYALYLLALTSTMRQGELLGLKWADMDWERGALH